MRIRKDSRNLTITLLTCFFVGSALVQIPAQDRPRVVQPRLTTQQQNDQQKKSNDRQRGENQPQELGLGAIKIDTELVQLDVTVIDQRNNPIFNLSKEDFTVYEDKVKQTIESVSREELPLSFGLAIDTSGSMRAKLNTVKDAALDLIRQMRTDDECFISQFKTEAELVQNFTSDKRRLEWSLGELYIGGGTALLDAIIATSDYAHAKGKRRRKALIVISDGLEKNSSVKEREVIQAIKENEVQVYLVGLIDSDEPRFFFGTSESRKSKSLLLRLAEDSGGRAFFPNDLDDIPAIAAQIAKDLRTQYVVNYYPSNDKRDGTFRKVQVIVNPKNSHKFIARTRQGYYSRDDRQR
jgi:Ca-activated chloride channel homolog